MTTAAAIAYMTVLQDKYGSPDLTDDENISFLNHAQNEYLNRLFPDNEGAVVNFEQDRNIAANVRFLMQDLSVAIAAGTMTNAAIDTAIGSSNTLFRVLNVGLSTAPYVVRYMKHNNAGAFNRNYFKRPVVGVNPRYTFSATGLKFYPTTLTTTNLTVLRKPKVITSGVAPEWDDYTFYNIIAIALQLAGVSVRDTELIDEISKLSVQNAK